ncbi:MAG: hypothetical protein IPK99_00570 [Flavobacteriales bacterium]|nr:hypothetical protein [Flavobacteriales bacterium]
MELIQHTTAWCKGEIFEGKMSLLFGSVILLVALAYWRFASTPAAKAMFVPLLAVGLMASAAGAYLVRTNAARIPEFEQAFAKDQADFAAHERSRTEAFIAWYPKTQWIIAGLMLIAMACMILSHAPWARAIGIGMMLAGFYVFVLHHFSEERAAIYHGSILEAVR